MRSKNQRFLKRVLAVLLSFIMVISMVRRNVYAASTTNPEDFTICVKDKDGLPISDATVTYEIFNESISLVTGNAITDKDGYFVLSEMASYETEISNGTVALNYTISKEGYSTQEASDVVVTDVKGNIDVTLLEEGALEATVSVKKTGSGIVKINGSESTEVKVVPNEQITIEVQAVDYNEGISHIKTLTIGKDTIQVDKNKTYSNDALVITEDTDIFVEFVTEYTVTANAEEGGRITINSGGFIMSKYSFEFKLKVVKEYMEEKPVVTNL